MGIITGATTLIPPTKQVGRQTCELKGPTDLTVFYLSISRPCQRSALWGLGLAVCADHFLSQLIHNDLALQILNRKHQSVQSVTSQKHINNRSQCAKIIQWTNGSR